MPCHSNGLGVEYSKTEGKQDMAKILIVDDELGMVMVIKRFLEKNDYEIVTASDGKEGLAKAQNEKPDLVLLDFMMPDMDGGDVVRALKSDSLTRNIPVIFLSAFVSSTEETKDQSSVNIDDTYYPAMTKPVDLLVLLANIEDLLKMS